MAGVTTTPTDDRVATRSTAALIMGRPEVGALIGAIAVAVLSRRTSPSAR
jgi:hypothetical protein